MTGIANGIAAYTAGQADAILDELTSHLIDRALLVPAGIVATTRAQERGYVPVSIG